MDKEIHEEIEKAISTLNAKDKAFLNANHKRLMDIAVNGGDVQSIIKELKEYADNQ